jgi:hypothetical protein
VVARIALATAVKSKEGPRLWHGFLKTQMSSSEASSNLKTRPAPEFKTFVK